MDLDLGYEWRSSQLVLFFAWLQHVGEVLAVAQISVALNAVAEVYNFVLAGLLLLILLGLLLLLGLFLNVVIGASSHEASHSLMGNFRSCTKSHTLHDSASDSTEHTSRLSGCLLNGWLLLRCGSSSSIGASGWWWSWSSSWTSSSRHY